MMIQSLKDLHDCLATLPTASNPKTNLDANTIGPALYTRLVHDSGMDPVLFAEGAKTFDWELESIGETQDPVFRILRTQQGTVALTTPHQFTGMPIPQDLVDAHRQHLSIRHRVGAFFKRLFGKESS